MQIHKFRVTQYQPILRVNYDGKATVSATKLSFITLSFITSIAIGFLLLSLVQSISLLHNIHYNNFVYAMTGKHYTITIPRGISKSRS